MALTEEQAKTKWCAHARVTDFVYNRDFAIASNSGCFCQGSDCMAWRWHDALTPDGRLERFLGQEEHDGKAPVQLPLEQRRGYCGLAGAADAFK